MVALEPNRIPDSNGLKQYLIQLLLPLYDNDGRAIPQSVFAEIRTRLTERFGGVTAFIRAPAKGLWKEEDGSVQRDDLVIYEVMANQLDRDWWRAYREALEQRFGQKELVIRAHLMERL